jgi:alkanesulfonate monooxygenase SsuD/methylene tetrahydromethanopterin reductase-like flavin-dependent oxidoreductase (luciferase family)
VKTDLLLMPMGARYTEMRAAAVAAEEAGFDGIWTWDHCAIPMAAPRPSCPRRGLCWPGWPRPPDAWRWGRSC